MLISHNSLLHLPVFTESNGFLGRIHSFDVDIESQSIIKYHVQGGGLLQGFLAQKLLVDRSQVVSISKDKMIVEDAVLLAATKESKASQPIKQASQPMMNKNLTK